MWREQANMKAEEELFDLRGLVILDLKRLLGFRL